MRQSTPVRRPMWIYERADRLAELAYRARDLAESLRRERCDQFHDPTVVARIDSRLRILETRFHCLAVQARSSRWLARTLPETSAD